MQARPIFDSTTASPGALRVVAALETVTVLALELEGVVGGANVTADGTLQQARGERFVFVFDGELLIETTKTITTVKANDLAHIPPGTGHRFTGTARAVVLAVPGLLPGERFDVPAECAAAADAGPITVTALAGAGFAQGTRPGGFAVQTLAGPSSGVTSCVINAARVEAGGAGPAVHIHDFDQLFIVVEGNLTVNVAGQIVQAGPQHVVVLGEGVPHTQWNDGSDTEVHLAVLVPPPPAGAPVTIPVAFDRRPAGGIPS